MHICPSRWILIRYMKRFMNMVYTDKNIEEMDKSKYYGFDFPQ